MAGSIFQFIYQAGNNQDYYVTMDKSNGILMGNTQLNNSALNGLPDNIEPRYALYSSTDGKVTRKIIVGNRSVQFSALPQSFTDPVIQANGSGAVFLRAFVAERIQVPKTVDTGLAN